MSRRLRFPLLLAAALAAGCGQEESATAAQARAEGVTGSVSKGPLQGATVTFSTLKPDGSADAIITGTTPATVVTDAAGAFGPVTGLPAGVPILVQTSGGSYVDESDPSTPRRSISFAAGEFLEAVLPAGRNALAINPYTMALYRKAKTQAANANFENVYAAVYLQAQDAFGFDPITTVPADPITGSGGSKEYALLLGAAALEINRIATTGSPARSPAYAHVIAFVTDFADGVLKDASDPSTQPSLADHVRRFRNDNYAVYSGTAEPSVDEAALSQPAFVANTAPAITGQSALGTAEDTALTLSVSNFTISDPDDASHTLAVQAGSNYTFAGNTIAPALNFNGTLTVNVIVTDARGVSSATFGASVTVAAVNDAPTGTPAIAGTAAENQTLTANAGGISDGDGLGPFSYQWSRGGVPVTGATSSTYLLGDADVGQTITVAVSYTDAGGTAEGPLASAATPAVANVNDPPSGVPAVIGTATEDQTLTADTSGISDADGIGSFSYQWLRGGSPISGATGGSYVLGDLDVGQTMAVQVVFTDGKGTVEGPLGSSATAAVANINDAPSAANDGPYAAQHGQTLNVAAPGVLANDSDPDLETLNASIVTGTSNGAVNVNGNGSFSYTPNGGYTGPDSFSYQACDAALACATAMVTINVVNTAPVAVDDPGIATTNEDIPVSVTEVSLVANDTSGDGDTLTVTGVSNFVGGVAVQIGGSIDFTPNPDFNGTASFDYTISDGSATDIGNVTITVMPVNDPPVANPDVSSANEDVVQNVGGILLNDTDPESDTLAAVLVSGPSNAAAFTLNASGSYSYTPAADFNGTDSFTYKANDGQVDSAPATVTLTVNPVNDAPAGTDNTVTPDEDTTYTFVPTEFGFSDVNDSPANAFAAVRIAQVPGNGTLYNGVMPVSIGDFVDYLDINSGQLVFAPDPDFNGAVAPVFLFQVQDDGGTANGGVDLDPALRTMAIVVNPVNDTPTITDVANQTITEDGSTGPLAFTIGDVDSVVDCAAVTSGSSNTALVPEGSVLISGTGTACTVEVAPAANGNGSATITLTVDDGFSSAFDTFDVAVTPVNDPPVVTSNGLTINEAATLLITTADLSAADDEAGELTYNVSPAPAAGTLFVDGVPGASSFTQTQLATNLVSYQHGGGEAASDSFTFTVSDTGAPIMTSDPATFTITVNGVNDPPSVSLPLLPLAMNQATEILPISIADADSASVTLTLSVLPVGTLTLKTDASPGGVIPDAQVSGNGTNSIVVTATVAQFNTTFAPLNNGLLLGVGAPGTRYSGAITLSADVDDGSGPVNDTALLHSNRFELSALAAGDASASTGLVANDFAGHAMAGGGDFNGDGFDDYVIGAPQANGFAGQVYVVFGSASGLPLNVDLSLLNGTNGFTVNGAVGFEFAGTALALDGDFNSDGLDDLLIGAQGSDAAYLIYGTSSAPATFNLGSICSSSSPSLLFTGAIGSQTGSAVAFGDVNGDGASDLLIGAPQAGAGEAYVVFGWQSSDSPLFPANFLVGECAGTPTIDVGDLDGQFYGFALGGLAGANRLGHSVASGDVNGDGVDDVVLGAPTDLTSPTGPGSAFVLFGHTDAFQATEDVSLVDGSTRFEIAGINLGDRTGLSVAAGDVNGDGFNDVIVGADRADPLARGDEGAAYVVYGAGGFLPTLDLSTLTGGNGFVIAGIGSGDGAGAQVAFAGDVNGDGFGDLLIAAPNGDPSGVNNAGVVSVVYGYAFSALYFDLAAVDGINGFHINGAASGDFITAVGRGGDLNGDGFDEIHLGTSQHAGNAGRGYSVFGYDFRRLAASINAPATATANGDILIDGSGIHDLDDGGFSGTVMKGGASNDSLYVTPLGPRVADGGSGSDTLIVSLGLLDLSAENAAAGFGRYRRNEAVYLTGNASLNVGIRDVLRMSEGGSLYVSGNTVAGNPVASNDAWLREGFDDGSGNAHYRQGYARLDVAEALNRDLVPVAFYWEAQTTTGNGVSGRPSLSGTGRLVVFESRADNLVGSPTVPVGVSQIYTRDLKTGAVTLISQNGVGAPGSADSTDPVISYDGRYVAFRTVAPEFQSNVPETPQVVMIDTTTGSRWLISDGCGDSCEFDSTSGRISLSADARYVTFIGRENSGDTTQVYRMDTQTGTLEAVSVIGGVPHCGTIGLPDACYSATMSGDGRYVAWSTPNDTLGNDANGVSDVFLRDMQTGELRLVSQIAGNSPVKDSAQPFISADGRRLAFESDAAFVAGDGNLGGDIYVYDIASQTLARASTGAAGEEEGSGFTVAQGEDQVGAPVLSGDGRVLMYTSDQSGLAPAVPSTNYAPYVKVLDCNNGCGIAGDGDVTGEIVRGHLARDAATFNGFVAGYALNFDGRVLAIETIADNVVGGDTLGQQDVFAGANPLYGLDLALDSDGDGLANADEMASFIGTNPLLSDTDGDGLSDGDEYNVYFTDPASPDTDGDGVGDGMEVRFGSDANAPQGQVLRVSPSGNDFQCNGQSFAAWDGNTPALVSCALQTNAGVTNVLLNGADAANRAYVLYAQGGNYGALDLTGVARQYISFVGSLDANVYKPTADAGNPALLSAFVPVGQSPAATISGATNVSFHNIRFTGGNGQGAGINVSAAQASSLVFEDVRVDNNGLTLGADGGGVYVSGGSTVTLRRSKVTGNSANNGASPAYGGGIMLASGYLLLVDTEVSGNTASGSGGTGIGGGIAVAGGTSNLQVQNSVIANNFADGQGGGVAVTEGAIATIELGSVVSANSVQGPSPGTGIGGGIYAGTSASLVLDGIRVAGNSAGDGGGGVYASGASILSVINTTLAANTASQSHGGGLYLIGSGDTDIRHSQFLANEAAQNGGGLHLENTTGAFTLFNNLIAGNHGANFSLSFGGGLYYAGTNAGQTNVHSNTFAYNQTQNQLEGGGGGAYFNQSANVDFINNIIQFNDNYDLTTQDVGQNVVDGAGAGALSYANNNIGADSNPGGIDADPLFTQGYYLTQAANASVDGATAPVFTAGSVGLLPPFTTSTDGSEDIGNLDLGYHHSAASTGALTAIANESPVSGSTLAGCGGSVVFRPQGTSGPLGAGRRIDVVMTTDGTISATLKSLTTLEPRGAGSRIATDYGDGTYGISVQGFSGAGNITLDIYADDEPTAGTITYSGSFGCS